MFNVRITRQHGGCEMSFASGASLNFSAGANWKGTIGGSPTFPENMSMSQTVGSNVNSGANLTEYKAGACLSFNLTGPSQTTFSFINGTSKPSILVGKDGTSALWAPPGSLYIRANGASIVKLYINVSQDTAGGSTWQGFDQVSGLA